MTVATISIDYDDTGTGLLINDFAANGNLFASSVPRSLTRAFLLGLIAEYKDKISHLEVNTTAMSHLDVLEDVGFKINEEYSEGHFVSATYEFESPVSPENGAVSDTPHAQINPSSND